MDIRMRDEESFHQLGFMGGQVVGNDVNLFVTRLMCDDVGEESDELVDVWLVAVLPKTSPVLVLKAAYSESVPCRKYSKPYRSARPGVSGSTGSLRSSA